MKNIVVLCLLGASLILGSPVEAQVCADQEPQASLQYLRRLSLDLRGRIPSLDEYASVSTNSSVEEALLDQMVGSDEFLEQIERYHRDLLWVNVSAQQIAQVSWLIGDSLERGRGRDGIYWNVSAGRSTRYRGTRAKCLDEPARFDPRTGEILTTPDANEPNVRREGWVLVRPYWAPETEIKVCAFDAQEALEAQTPQGQMVNCKERPFSSAGCGCGPNLSWCHSRIVGTDRVVLNSMNQQLLRFTRNIVGNDLPYTEVLVGKSFEVNGPLAHYYRHQTHAGFNTLFALPDPGYAVPELSFTETNQWQTVTRSEKHSGVLTSPAFLTKFASNRGRANRFFEAFTCTSYAPPPGGLAPSDDPCHQEPDLTERCGCKFCHTSLEPAAAHWGRFSESGIAELNLQQFPKERPECTTPRGANSAYCRRFYITETLHEKEQPYLGMLQSYLFADALSEANIEQGPQALARKSIDSGAFARCTVNRMWTYFMGRAPEQADQQSIEKLSQEFISGNYKIKSLVKSIVTRPEYIKAGRF